jgi:Uma2 family endonuclease
MLEATRLMTLDEYIERYEREGAFEVYDGEIIPLMPNVTVHSWIIGTLYLLLDSFCKVHKLGKVMLESSFVLTQSRQWVKGSRVPDVAFYAADRFKAYIEANPDWLTTPMLLVPDLVVEVVSENDRYSDLHRKIAAYRADGVRLIWVVDYFTRSVNIYAGDHFSTLKEADMLTGGDVLPGFSVAVSELFTFDLEV